MPTVQENIQKWNEYNWPGSGEEWSTPWGSAEAQWDHTIFPRIGKYLKTHPRVLEIGPGMGKWTQRLLRYAHTLVAVDVSKTALDGLEAKFLSGLTSKVRERVSVHLGDGVTLPVESESVDFVFSFDSLVHADADTLDAYLMESARVLDSNGVGFIHHANQAGGREWRGTATADSMLEGCKKARLQCYTQEVTSWVTEGNSLIDCFTFFGKIPRRKPIRVQADILAEAKRAKLLAELYG